MVPVLTLYPSSNILRPLHRELLPKIYINRNFLVAIIPLTPAVGRLRLKLLEIE